MKLLLKTFGPAREIMGGSEVSVVLQGQTVGELRGQLLQTWPPLTRLRSIMIAVNETYAEDEVILQPGDIVALIPPVNGG